MADDPSPLPKPKGNGGTFRPGHGRPGPGRPKGSRNEAYRRLDALAEGAAEEIIQAVLEKAKAGEPRAIELVAARIWPQRKGRPVTFDLPPITGPADLMAALASVATAMAAGELTPDEASAVANVLETHRRAIETVDLEARLVALEAGRSPM